MRRIADFGFVLRAARTCQTSEAAVAKSGVAFLLVDVLKMVAQLAERVRQAAFDAEIAHGVAEEAANQELEGKVVHANSVTIAKSWTGGGWGGGGATFYARPAERSAG